MKILWFYNYGFTFQKTPFFLYFVKVLKFRFISFFTLSIMLTVYLFQISANFRAYLLNSIYLFYIITPILSH